MENFLFHYTKNIKKEIIEADDEEEDDDNEEEQTINNDEQQKEKDDEIKLKDGKTEKELFNILDSDRADEWGKWLNIGFILYHELKDDGYYLFDAFLKNSDKYNKLKVLKRWESIKDNTNNPKTIKSLMNYAKIDNEDEPIIYKNVINEFINFGKNEAIEKKGAYEQANMITNSNKVILKY
jgi:hypothetical protein